MNRKPLVWALVAMGLAITLLNQVAGVILAAGAWIYLVRMVRKQEHATHDGQADPGIPEGQLKKLRALLTAAGLAFLVFIASAVVHNVLHGLSRTEETVSLAVSLAAMLVFVLATAGGLVLFLKGRQEAI